MARTKINVLDPRGFEAGAVLIHGADFAKIVTGHKLQLEPSRVYTTGGTPFSPEAAGFATTGDRSNFIPLTAETNVFGGPLNKWTFHTNAFGANYIRRMSIEEDAGLFRLWVRAAETSPGRVAQMLNGCLTADDYRRALVALRRQISNGQPQRDIGGRA